MPLTQNRSRLWLTICCFVLVTVTSLSALPLSANAEHLLALQLAPTPFSPSMCKISKDDASIRILVAKHHNLFLKKVPGQYQPENTTQSRKKDYVNFVTLSDLTDGQIPSGAIAFDNHHAVIFNEIHPKGISRPKFMAKLSDDQRLIGEMTLNTFLRLRPIFIAAIDTCRPHPAFSDYENDDYLYELRKDNSPSRILSNNTTNGLLPLKNSIFLNQEQ